MTVTRRIALALTSTLFLLPALAAQQDDDSVFIDVVKKDFIDRVARARANKDWKALFDSYHQAMTPKLAQKMVQPDPKAGRWVGLMEYLNTQFADLPPEALSFYREQYDGSARQDYKNARAAGDRDKLQQLVEQYFFSTVVDDALDLLGNLYCEERRYQDAVYYWRRLLENYPDSQIPRHLVAARIAMCAEMWENGILLDYLRGYVKARQIDGPLLVAGRATQLSEYLASIKIDSVAPIAVAGPKLPYIPEPEARYARKLVGVRNEIRRWSYDMTKDLRGNVPKGMPQAPDGYMGEFPYVAATTKLNGKSYVVFSNGARVVAIDPTKVGTHPDKEKFDTYGVYWKFPEGKEPIKVPRPQNNFGMAMNYSPPFIGVSIDGEQAFATVYSEKRQLPNNPQSPDIFVGTTRMVCLNVRNREKLWDTDDEPLNSFYKKAEFWDRNFSFSTPPMVRGDRLFVGLCSSPMGEQESRVVCIDRRTGMIIWDRFLASVSNARPWWGGAAKYTTSLTMLAEDRGVIYAHSNLGVVAALNGMTGNVMWLSKYPRISQKGDNFRGEPQQALRPASPIVIYNKKLYVLPQDQYEMQIFDMAKGDREEVANIEIGTEAKRLDWRKARRLVGMVQNWMVVGAEGDAYIINLEAEKGRNPKGYNLPQSNVANCGLGAIDGETIYLPTSTVSPSTPYGALAIYHGIRSWRNISQEKWKEANEYGNLLVAGNYLVVASNKLSVFTDVETIRTEFAQRLNQSPPNPIAYLEHGDLMRSNDRLVEAAESYLTFVSSAEGDPRFTQKVRDVKTELHGIFIKRGIDAASNPDPKRLETAVDYFRMAKGFAYDDETFADAARRLADTYEKLAAKRNAPDEQLEMATRAVEEYQALIEKSRDTFYKPENSEIWQKSWKHASSRINEIVKAYGDKAYEPVQKIAAEAYRKAVAQGPKALRAVIDFYPDSRAANDAILKMADIYSKEQKWDKVLSTLREVGEKYPNLMDAELQRRINEALEKLGDTERLEEELKKSSKLYRGQKVKINGALVGYEEYAENLRERIKASVSKTAPLIHLPLAKTWDLGEVSLPASAGANAAISMRPVLLNPLGPEPPRYGMNRELFARGSSIELWDVKENKMLWSAVHPMGWFGASFMEAKDGGVKLTSVYGDSPAAKAGLQNDDVVLMVDGKAPRGDTFDILTGADPGTNLSLTIRRAGKMIDVTVTTSPWPKNAKPGIVGAVFTRDYGIAVVWENQIAGLDLETGKVRWRFRSVRDRYVLQNVQAVDGRILVHEHFKNDRARSPQRGFASDDPQRMSPIADDLFSRFLCIDDSNGEVAWARPFPFDAETAAEHSIRVFAPYYGTFASVLAVGYHDKVRAWEQYTFKLKDGEDLRRKVFLGQVLSAWAVDDQSGTIWAIDGSSNFKILRNFSMWPEPPTTFKQVEIRLDPKYVDQVSNCFGLIANKDHVVVLAPPLPQGAGSQLRVAVFTTAGAEVGSLQSETFQKERTIPGMTNDCRWVAGLVELDRDGVVYLYNEARSKTGAPLPQAERRAYLTALRPVEGKLEVAWESVGPSVRNLNERGLLYDLIVQGDLVMLYAPKGSLPGETTDQPVATVHSKKDGGYLERQLADVSPLTDVFGAAVNPLQVRHGRLVVHKKNSVEILGD